MHNFFFGGPSIGNPFLGTKLVGFSIGRGSGALKGEHLPKTGSDQTIKPLRHDESSRGRGLYSKESLQKKSAEFQTILG